MKNIDIEREVLVQSVTAHERELEVALADVRGAVQRTLAVGEHVAKHPLPWLVSGLLAGVWLGHR